jgi:carboxypeptidase A2
MFVGVGLLVVALGIATASQEPSAATRKRYDGYKVFNVVPTDLATLQVLHDLLVHDSRVDFWREPSRVGQEVAFMVAPLHQMSVVAKLRRAGIRYSVQIDDVQAELTPMWDDIDRRRADSAEPFAFDLNDYNTLDDINAWMTSLVAQCREGLTCEVYSLGDSYEGRPINLFKISKTGSGRKAYWLDATIHAREWITTATIVNIMDRLAKGSTSEAVSLTDSYDWYFVPVINVDGYAYTWSDERLWRKNRRPTSSSCYGVDLNRNFDFRWGNDGVSHLPCDETYCGPSGGSEPETQAVSAELVRVGPTLGATVTLHSYGNMWMFPWGNTVDYNGRTCDLADDNADLMLVSDATADAIENTYGTNWARGNSCVVIYATTGGTDDYAKGAAGVKYAFCPELRGNSFVIAASQIPLSFEEIWNGLVVMVDTIAA